MARSLTLSAALALLLCPLAALAATYQFVVTGTADFFSNSPEIIPRETRDFTLTLNADTSGLFLDQVNFPGTSAESLIDYYDPLSSGVLQIDGLGTYSLKDPITYRAGYNRTTGNFFFDSGMNNSRLQGIVTVQIQEQGTILDITENLEPIEILDWIDSTPFGGSRYLDEDDVEVIFSVRNGVGGTVSGTVVPLPGALALMFSGLLTLGGLRRFVRGQFT